MNFIVEILRRYRTLPIWKKVLKQIQAYEYDRFRKVFQAMDYSEDLGREIRYTVDGFIKLYARTNKDQSKNKEFENTIRVSTQYDWICVVFELTSILRGVHPIKMKDIEKSISGVLLEDYYDWVKRLKADMLNLLALKDMEWILIVNLREKEYMEMLQHCPDEVDEFIGELQKRINNRFAQETKDVEAKRKYEENIRKRTNESLRAQIVREEIIKAAKDEPVLAKEAFKRLVPKTIDELFD